MGVTSSMAILKKTRYVDGGKLGRKNMIFRYVETYLHRLDEDILLANG